MDHDPSARASELRALLIPFISKRVDPQDVDDVLQTVFVRIQRGLGELRDSDKVIAWSYQIARNVIVDHARRGAVRRHETLDRVGAMTAPAAGDDIDSGANELAVIVGHFIAMLPTPYREALQLTELDGMTQAMAAERVGLSLSGMKSRVQRARTQLRELLERCCEIELDTRGGIIDVEPNNPPPDLPNCCARAMRPSDRTPVSRDMTNDQQAPNTETTSPTTTGTATRCCGGPAPADAEACCVQDAAAKAAGEPGCGCSSRPAAAKRSCC